VLLTVQCILMLPLAISCRRHSVFRLSVRPCVHAR